MTHSLIFITGWLQYILPLWLVGTVIGFISWPVSSQLFKKSSDKGYTYGIILGLFAISYIYFVLAMFGIVTLGVWGLSISVLIWLIPNILIEFKQRIIRTNFNLPQFIKTNLLFIVIATFWYWVRGHTPDIYDIERFMDYGILNSIFNSGTLPLEDFWMSGNLLNYYYFSHFVIYTILKLSFIHQTPGFIAIICWSFGLLAISAFRFGKDLFDNLFGGKDHSYRRANIAGILSVFLVVFAANFHVVEWLIEIVLTLLKIPHELSFWYADGTRYILDAITEMPVYAFSISDNHPHTWGLFNGVLVMALLLNIWVTKYKNLKETLPHMLGLTIILGWGYLTNSWDFATLGLLTIFILLFKFWQNPLFFFSSTIGAILGGLAIAWSWSHTIFLPISGIGFSKAVSDPIEWFVVWGALLILGVISLRIFKLPKIQNPKVDFLKKLSHRILKHKSLLYYLIVFFVVVGFWVGIEVFYVKDLLSDGPSFRANTVFKVGFQLWLWLGLILGPSITMVVVKLKTTFWDKLTFTIISIILILMLLGSFKMIHQANLAGKDFVGIDQGFEWINERFPQDYKALKFLETQPKGNILEADGDSFTDNNYYSVYLGWPSVIGWSGHEWTWRGSYDPVGEKREIVRSIYTSDNRQHTMRLIEDHNIRYIVVGGPEKAMYGEEINHFKLESIGAVIYRDGDVVVYEVGPPSVPPKEGSL